jgi:hypothetical protein
MTDEVTRIWTDASGYVYFHTRNHGVLRLHPFMLDNPTPIPQPAEIEETAGNEWIELPEECINPESQLGPWGRCRSELLGLP